MDKALLDKFLHPGSGIVALSDEEIQKLIVHFTALQTALTPCPDEYRLVRHDVYRNLDRLNDMKRARDNGKAWACNIHQTRGKAAPQISVRV